MVCRTEKGREVSCTTADGFLVTLIETKRSLSAAAAFADA